MLRPRPTTITEATMYDDLRTEHLRLNYLDVVYLGDVPLGHVDRDPPWPATHGPEPTWYLTELGEMLDAWRDREANAWEDRREAWATYERNLFR